MLTREAAEEAAAELRDRMEGREWKVHVWENARQYFYRVYNGGLSVQPSGTGGTYYTLFSVDGQNNHGETFWKNALCFNDPNDAVKAQLQVAKKFVESCSVAISEVKSNVRCI